MKNNLIPDKGGSHLTINYRDFNSLDPESLKDELESVDWSNLDTLTMDESVKSFNEIFTAIIDKHIPKISKRVKRSRQPGWLNSDIKRNMKLRDNAKKRGRFNEHKYYRNLTTRLIREAKKKYYTEYVVDNKHNPRKISKLFDELAGKTKLETIPTISCNNSTTTDSKEIADILNKHFTNIADKYASNFQNQDEPDFTPLRQFIQSKLPPGNIFKIPPMTEHHMAKLIKDMDVSKATGLDDISAKIIKLSGPYITKVLVQICNRSIETGTFPKPWKMAKVIPLYKKNGKEDPGNYRPISILPVLSKILEKHVATSLLEFLNVNDLLAKRQSGFRSKHSCETALHLMIDEWSSHLLDKKMVGLLFVDFSKAFDLVDHKIILQKLAEYNFHDSSLAWFTSYLSDRKQIVKVNGCTSEECPIKSGVPQGSILGPIIFLMSINDLPLQETLSDIAIFADDATESACGEDIEEIETKLQRKANTIEKWATANKMVVNGDKTKGMLMTSQQKLRTLTNSDLNIKVSGKTIEQVDSEQLLGVKIDYSLTWDDQVKQVRKKVLYKLSLLRKIKQYLPVSVRKLYHNYYVKPHLDYCSTVWGHTTDKNLDKIYKLQKQSARLILDKDYSTPTVELLKELNWITFAETIKSREATLVYKTLNNSAPSYMSEMFQYVKDVGRPDLRSTTENKLYIPKAHHKSIRYSAPRTWNNISNEVRQSSSLSQFKREYLSKVHRVQ